MNIMCNKTEKFIN